MLESYFISKKKDELLAYRSSNRLDGKIINKISNELVDFAIDAFGFDGVTTVRKKMIAIAAVALFVGLKMKDSDCDGTVIVF